MKRKNFKLLILMLLVVPLLTSCGLFREEEEEFDASVTVVESIDDMEDGSFYVKKSDKEYHKPYIGNVTFTSDGNEMPSTDPKNIAWFGQDITKIPTMYKGEKIVYKSSIPFGERFPIQRYFDLGYTIGISGLEKGETGRFYFPVSADKYNINLNSSARAVYDYFGEESILLESLGDTPLRAGNVSVAGTIKGLEKGKTYSNYMYQGTNLKKFNLTADVMCLSAAEDNSITDYEYTKSKTVEFTFPSYYNSGYYLVGGFGFVRYVNSDQKFSEDMDMNVPNVYPKKDDYGNDIVDDTTEYIRADDITETSLFIDHQQKARVIVSIDNSSEEEQFTVTPTVKLIGEDKAYTLESKDGKTYQGEFDLSKGSYNIQLIGLSGRTFSYKILDLEKDTFIDGSGKSDANKGIRQKEEPEVKKESDVQDNNDVESPDEGGSMADKVNKG